MKKLTLLLFLILAVSFSSVKAQLAEDSWAFGFGGSYPRLVNYNVTVSADVDYGGFISFQRNFSEHVGLRLGLNYNHLEGKWGSPLQISKTNAYAAGLDLLIYLFPCETVSPYFVGGGGPLYFNLEKPADATLTNNYLTYQVNIGFGAEWSIGNDWKLKTEGNYHTSADSRFDGIDGSGVTGGLFGGPNDTYVTFDFGFVYYFSKGAPSKYCQLYTGISQDMPEPVDYKRIEDIVEKHIPKEVVKQVVVPTPSESNEKWVLVGVNFDFNSAKLQNEAYPILFHAVQVLLRNPDMKVEIQGYTDNIGSESYNQKLSQRRAQTVKSYLTARGVSPDRLKVGGYGETMPIADNKTAAGRSMNRRIEFKVLK